MPEAQQQQTSQQGETEVDDKGVPLSNRLKELERKLQDKYEKELAETRRELQELKSSFEPKKTDNGTEDIAKADLMEFVKNPKGFMRSAYEEVEFQRQIPQAESWLKTQKGYSSSDDERILQIIKENKLNTPYHSPMERATTAWRLLNAEKHEKQASSQTDEEKREASLQRSSAEGTGKATPKQAPVTRTDILRKLAEAEAKGDLDASIKYTSMLEDVRQ